MANRPADIDRIDSGLTFLIEDDRYSVPTLRFACLDPARARQFARELLADSEHHRSVETWQGDTRVYRMERGTRGVY
jgi:hypothetical protein